MAATLTGKVVHTWVDSWAAYVKKDGSNAPAGKRRYALIVEEGLPPDVVEFPSDAPLPKLGEPLPGAVVPNRYAKELSAWKSV